MCVCGCVRRCMCERFEVYVIELTSERASTRVSCVCVCVCERVLDTDCMSVRSRARACVPVSVRALLILPPRYRLALVLTRHLDSDGRSRDWSGATRSLYIRRL